MDTASTIDVPLALLGRLHPLVLHLPIGLTGALVLAEAWRWRRGDATLPPVLVPLAWLNAATAAAAAVSGLLLAGEPGYGGETLDRHRLLGIVFAVVALLVAAAASLSARRDRPVRPTGFRVALGAGLLLLVPVGHLGATMTHGEGFLTAPLRAADPATSPAAAHPTVAEGTPLPAPVAAVLNRTCTGCHGASRTKGLLALHTLEAVKAGGEHGPVVEFGDPESSELLVRIGLPTDDDDHMPPPGKPQPTAEEIETLRAWIAAGEGGASLASAPDQPAESAPAPVPPPAPRRPDAAAIDALRSRLVHVQAISAESPLLWIDFAAARDIGDQDMQRLLAPLMEFVGELSLARTAVTDASLGLVNSMASLRRLDVRDTAVTDAGVARLAGHPALEELILAGTKVTDASLAPLRALPALRRVYLWRTTVTHDPLVAFRAERPQVSVDAEQETISAALETEPALAFSGDAPPPGAAAGQAAGQAAPAPAASLAPINAVCPVSGAAVNPTYVIVWEGREVGFCCEKCAAKFWADPATYVAAIKPK